MRRTLRLALLLLGIGIAYLFWFRADRAPSTGQGTSSASVSDPQRNPDEARTGSASTGMPPGRAGQLGSSGPSITESDLEANFPIAAPLNAPGSTVARDLDIVSQLFDAWQSNFPREGNPVGENAEITAALLGDNRLELALLPKAHRALNERGELCDRWGTPFRFHQLSGTRMEIQSAGPDRVFATSDDAIWTPH